MIRFFASIRHILIFLAMAVLTALVLPSKKYEPARVVPILAEKPTTGEGVRIFHNASLTTYTDYFTFMKDAISIMVLEKPVYAACAINGAKFKKLFINKKTISLMRTRIKGCSQVSPIRAYNKLKTNNFILFTNILSGFIVSSFIFALFKIFRFFRRLYLVDRPLILKLVFTSMAAAFVIYTYSLMSYPALFDTDIFDATFAAKSHEFNHWFGFLTNPLFAAFLNFTDNFRIFTFSSLFTAVSLYTCLLYFYRKIGMSYKWWIYLTLLLVLPPMAFMLNHLTRDLLSSYCHLILAFSFLARQVFNHKDGRKLQIHDVLFILTAVFASVLRREAILTSSLFLVLYFFSMPYGARKRLKAISLFVGTFLFISTLGSALKPGNFSSEAKLITSLSLPISYIVTKDYKSEDKEKDRKFLERYFHYDIFTQEHQDHVVFHIHKGALKRNRGSAKNLAIFASNLFLSNPWLFLEGRLKLAYHTLMGTKKTIRHPRDLEFMAHSEYLRERGNSLGFFHFPEAPFPKLKELGMWLQFHSTNNYAWARKLYSLLPQLILCLLSLILFKRTPLTAMGSAVILARMPAFFLLLPAAQFKYVFDLYAYGLFAIPLFIWELKRGRV